MPCLNRTEVIIYYSEQFSEFRVPSMEVQADENGIYYTPDCADAIMTTQDIFGKNIKIVIELNEGIPR